MRDTHRKNCICFLALMWLAALPPHVPAQTALLVDWNATWKYWANTNNYTTNSPVPIWCTNTFNDTAWPSRPGVIFAEFDPVATETFAGVYGGSPSWSTPPLATTNQYGTYIQTFYFRTHFNYNGPATTGVMLQLETFQDDGAVFYLNGRELPGTRVAMPFTAVDWSTSATGTTYGDPATAVTNRVLVSSLSVADLRIGDNLLAAEVHQMGSSSPDMVFGMRLLSRPMLPPTIVSNDPPTLFANVESGTTALLGVTPAGDTPFGYRWRRGPDYGDTKTNIVGAPNSASYSFVASPATLGTNPCYYDVIVTNAYGRATSSVFTVQVYVNSLVITQQPTNQTADVGYTNVTLNVQVFGTQPSFQWQTNTLLTGLGTWTNIFRATNSNYIIASVTTNHARLHRCVLTNWNGSVTSSPALLMVYPDLTGPILISATAEEEASNRAPYRVTVRFSENLTVATATVVSNYIINLADTSLTMNITNARGSGGLFQLFVDGLKTGSNYVLTVNNVRDSRNNVIAPNSQIGLTWLSPTHALVSWDSLWRFTDYPSLPTNWWNIGPGLFCGEREPLSLCMGACNTLILLGPIPYHFYFFTTFTNPGFQLNDGLHLRAVLCGNAMFYVNGVEVYRFTLPPGVIPDGTPAEIMPWQPLCISTPIPRERLASGTNALAAEVELSYYASMFCFGAALNIVSTNTCPLPYHPAPRLHCARQGDQVTLWWEGGGYALETSTNLCARWLEVQPDMANAYTTSLTNAPTRFWRLHRKQF